MSKLEQYKKASAKREFYMACTTLYNNLVGIGSEPSCKHESCKLDTNPKMRDKCGSYGDNLKCNISDSCNEEGVQLYTQAVA
jgi:hypothetical protein